MKLCAVGHDGLLLQTRLKPYMKAIELTLSDEGVGFGFSQVDACSSAGYEKSAEAVRDLLICSACVVLNFLHWAGKAWANSING